MLLWLPVWPVILKPFHFSEAVTTLSPATELMESVFVCAKAAVGQASQASHATTAKTPASPQPPRRRLEGWSSVTSPADRLVARESSLCAAGGDWLASASGLGGLD